MGTLPAQALAGGNERTDETGSSMASRRAHSPDGSQITLASKTGSQRGHLHISLETVVAVGQTLSRLRCVEAGWLMAGGS